MKVDQYFKLEVNFMSDDCVSTMMEEMDAAESLGIYVALLVHLRKHDEYEAGCSSTLLEAFAHGHDFRLESVERVLRDFGLFIFNEERQTFRSTYLDRVMRALEEHRRRCSEAGKKSALKRTKNGNAVSPSGKGIETNIQQKSKVEESREENISLEKNRKETARENERDEKDEKVEKKEERKEKEEGGMRIVDPDRIGQAPLQRADRSWDVWVDRAAASEEYMNEVGVHSGLGKLFIEYRQRIVRLFKEHIRLYGTEGSILSESDAKRYFTNFMRAGTITCFKVRDALMAESNRLQHANPYCFEVLVDGQRTYLGRPIPTDAPPRPDNSSVWNDRRRCWSY